MTDSIKLRDDIASDYQRNYERLGVRDVSFEAFQKIAALDLDLVDKDDAKAKSAPSKKPASLVQEAKRDADPELAEQLADNLNGQFYRRAVADKPVAPKARIPLQAVVGEKGAALSMRFAKILEVDQKAMIGKPKNLAISDLPYKYPALAKDALQQFADYTMCRRAYRALNDTDRNRLFLRRIEDIADRSTGLLGPWWVK